MSNATAKKVAAAPLKGIILRWEVPHSLDSDHGTHFTGALIGAVCRALKI